MLSRSPLCYDLSKILDIPAPPCSIVLNVLNIVSKILKRRNPFVWIVITGILLLMSQLLASHFSSTLNRFRLLGKAHVWRPCCGGRPPKVIIINKSNLVAICLYIMLETGSGKKTHGLLKKMWLIVVNVVFFNIWEGYNLKERKKSLIFQLKLFLD